MAASSCEKYWSRTSWKVARSLGSCVCTAFTWGGARHTRVSSQLSEDQQPELDSGAAVRTLGGSTLSLCVGESTGYSCG
jgi:hypothetical protein